MVLEAEDAGLEEAHPIVAVVVVLLPILGPLEVVAEDSQIAAVGHLEVDSNRT